MTVVGLDTMVLIHAVRRGETTDSTEQIDLRRRTLARLETLRGIDARIVVSTIALSELLCGVKPEHRGPVTAKINARFWIRPVDVAVATFAAELWTTHRGLPDDARMERRALKADVFVVAASKLAGASLFFSHDKRCRTLASLAGLDAKDLPSDPEDLSLDAEIDEGRGESGLEAGSI